MNKRFMNKRLMVVCLGVVFLLGACSPDSGDKDKADAGAAKAAKAEKPKKAGNPYKALVPVEIGRHAKSATHVAFSKDGQFMVTTGKDKLVKVWDAAGGKLLKDLKGHTGDVMMAAFSPDGQLVVSASSDETARVWDWRKGKCLKVLKEKPINKKKLTEEELTALAAIPPPQVAWAVFSPDGKSVITAGDDFKLKIWDVKTGKKGIEMEDLGCRQRRVYRRVDAAGWLSSAGCMDDGIAYLRFWDDKGMQTGSYGDEDHDAHYIAIDRSTKFMVTADGSMSMSVYSAQGSLLKRLLVGAYHFCLEFGPGDKTFLVGTDGGKVFVFDTDTWRRIGSLSVGEIVAIDGMALNTADNSLTVAMRNGKIMRFAQPIKLPAK